MIGAKFKAEQWNKGLLDGSSTTWPPRSNIMTNHSTWKLALNSYVYLTCSNSVLLESWLGKLTATGSSTETIVVNSSRDSDDSLVGSPETVLDDSVTVSVVDADVVETPRIAGAKACSKLPEWKDVNKTKQSIHN